MDAIETFKNKASQNYANYSRRKKQQDGMDQTSSALKSEELNKFVKQQQEATRQQASNDAKSQALASSNQQNIAQNTNAGAQVNARIAQAQQAIQQAKQAQPTKQVTQQSIQKGAADEGWKKYYDAEFKKQKDNMGFLERLLDNGNASKRAETIARNKYATELIENNNREQAQNVANYNVQFANQAAKEANAAANAIGATKETENMRSDFRNTLNAIKQLGSAPSNLLLNVRDNNKEGFAKLADDFFRGMADSAVYMISQPVGVGVGIATGLGDAIDAFRGYGTDFETGKDRELTGLERGGRAVNSFIQLAKPLLEGSKVFQEGVGQLGKVLFSKGGTEIAKSATSSGIKGLLKAMAEEGLEEGIQQASEFFGNGGVLTTSDGKFDNEAFKQLMTESGQAAAMGAAMAGGRYAGGKALRGVANKINQAKTDYNANTVVNENINTEEDVNVNENVAENINEDIKEDVEVNSKPATTPAENALVETSNYLRTSLPEQTKVLFNQEIQQITNQLDTGRISKEEYQQRVAEIQQKYVVAAEQAQAVVQEESATGQPTNPNEVTAVENAEGTQATQEPISEVTPAETNYTEGRETQGMQNTEELGEGMAQRRDLGQIQQEAMDAYERAIEAGDTEAAQAAQELYNLAYNARATENLSGYDVDKGVVINRMLAEQMFNRGYDSANALANEMFNNTEGRTPIAHDYTTGEDLYFMDDIVSALKRDGYTDAAGNKYESGNTIRAAEENNFRNNLNNAIEESSTQNAETNQDLLNDMFNTISEESNQGYIPQETQPVSEINKIQQTVDEGINAKLAEQNETGMTPELRRKIYEERFNATQEEREANLDAILSAEEQGIAKEFFLKKANGDAAAAEKMYDSAYITAQRQGTEYVGRAAQEFFEFGKLGDPYHNYQAIITPAEADFSGMADADYSYRNSNPEEYIKNDISKWLSNIAPDANPEGLTKAADVIYKSQQKLNETADNVSKRIEKGEIKDQSQLLSDKTIRNAEVFKTFSEAGKALGIAQDNNAKTSGISLFQKIDSTGNWIDAGGLNEEMMVRKSIYTGDTDTMVDALKQRLTDIKPERIDDIADRFRRNRDSYIERFGDEGLADRKMNEYILNTAWRENAQLHMMRNNYTDVKTNQVINESLNLLAYREKVAQTNSQKIAGMVQGIMNSSMRGLKWKTTLNEIPEICKTFIDYGTFKIPKLSEMDAIIYENGQGGNGIKSFLDTVDAETRVKIEQATAEYNAKLEKLQQEGGSAKEQAKLLTKFIDTIYPTVNKVTGFGQWNAFVQKVKDATYLYNGNLYYSKKLGLDISDPRVKQATSYDFDRRMLPQDEFFKYINVKVAALKPIFLYTDSSARLTDQFITGATGRNKAGINADMGVGGRLARNSVDVASRAIWAVLTGTNILAVTGIPQWTEDYTGLDDEDKNLLDYVVNIAGSITPVLGLIKQGYFNWRQEQVNKEKGYDINKSWQEKTLANAQKMFTPFGSKIDEAAKFIDTMDKGASVNDSGRVQYLAPDLSKPSGWVDLARGAIAGKGNTTNAREYNNNPDLLSTLMSGDWNNFFQNNNAYSDITDMFGITTDKDYNRPASNTEGSDYNAKIQKALKAGDRAAAEEWYNKAQEYNSIIDDLRVNNPEALDIYYAKNGDNLVSPEKYKVILYGNSDDGKPDLTVWNTMKALKIKANQDLGTPIDPAYTDLNDEQARRYLQYKATATGEDTILSRDMKIDPFWKEFFKKQQDFYDKNGYDFDDSRMTQRVQDWNRLDKEKGYMYAWDGINSSDINEQKAALRLQMTYPTMYAYNSMLTALKANYGEEYKNTQEYKNFWRTYGDAYNKEQDAYDKEMLYIINQMRAIEGYDDMTLDEYQAINNLKVDKDSNYTSSGSSYSWVPTFSNTFNADPYYLRAKSSNPRLNWKGASRTGFYNIPMSGTAGKDPYAVV